MSDGSLIQSVDRALSILECFTLEHREWGVTDLSKKLGLNKSTVFGLLSTLERRDYVEKTPEGGKYRLGLKLLDLGTIKHESLEVVSVAQPVLSDLVQRFQETVHIAIYDSGSVVYVDKKDSKNTLASISWIGKRNPAYCTGVGKCLLAFQSEEELRRVIAQGLQAFTSQTITDPETLRTELARVREEGVAFDREEIERGLACVAAPIRDHLGRVIASISLSAPTIRLDTEMLTRITESVRAAAATISLNLGFKKRA